MPKIFQIEPSQDDLAFPPKPEKENAPDYENNLVFEPKSADDLNKQERQSEVLIKDIEKTVLNEEEFIIGEFYSGKGIYYGKNEDGEDLFAYEKDTEKVNWDEGKSICEKLAKSTGKPYRMPTKEELRLLYIRKEIVNKGLEKAGKEKLKESWYWSSSEYASGAAWFVDAGNGEVDWSTKNFYYYVRCVLAF